MNRTTTAARGLRLAGISWLIGLLAAVSSSAQPNDTRLRWDHREFGPLLEKVCSQARRCAQGMAPERFAKELLSLPLFGDGRSPREREALIPVAGKETAQLEHALEQTLQLMKRTAPYSQMSRAEHLDVITEELMVEYNAGYWSTLPDDLRWFDQATRDRPASNPNEIEIGHFSVDIENSWPNSSTYILEATLSISNGPPTHFLLRCDQCESITSGDQWTAWDDWLPTIVAIGEGYKNICIELRAEPVNGNWANTAIACDELGTPPEPDPPTTVVAESNNPVQRCFGAIGTHCGPADQDGLDYGHCIRLHPITDPNTARCQINAGSWTHDECCIAKRVGGNAPADEQGSCSPHMAALLDQPYVCQAEFNQAVAHILLGFSWWRDVDASIENTTGVVDFASYCAPTGTVLQFDGVERFCCSRSGQPWVQHAGDLSGLRWICL